MILNNPDKINNDHIDFSACIRNKPIMDEERISFNIKINIWNLIPIPVPLNVSFLARMIPPNPTRKIIIFITIIIFLIYTLPAHTYLPPHPKTNQ